MTSYLVPIETDHHLTCLKMRSRNKRTATENVRSREKIERNLRGLTANAWKRFGLLALRYKRKSRLRNISLLVDESSLNAMKQLDQLYTERAHGRSRGKALNKIWSPPRSFVPMWSSGNETVRFVEGLEFYSGRRFLFFLFCFLFLFPFFFISLIDYAATGLRRIPCHFVAIAPITLGAT